jgi:hypothetical protein
MEIVNIPWVAYHISVIIINKINWVSCSQRRVRGESQLKTALGYPTGCLGLQPYNTAQPCWWKDWQGKAK